MRIVEEKVMGCGLAEIGADSIWLDNVTGDVIGAIMKKGGCRT